MMWVWLILLFMLAGGLGMIIFLARREGAAQEITKAQKGLLQNIGKSNEAVNRVRRNPDARRRVRDKYTRRVLSNRKADNDGGK